MKFSLNIHALFPFLTLVQTLVFASIFVLRGRREARHADFWLAVLLIAQGLNGVPFLLGWLGYYDLWEKYTFLPWDGLWWLVPPLFYLFLKSLTNENWRFSLRQDGKHFIPYTLFFLYHLAIGGYGLLVNRDFVVWWWREVDEHIFFTGFQVLLSVIQQAFYLWLGLRLYRDYEKWAAEQFSDTETVSFIWLRNALIFNVLMVISNYALTIVNQIYGINYDNMWWNYLADTIVVYYLSISALMQIKIRGGVHFSTQMVTFDLKNGENTEGGLEAENESKNETTNDNTTTENFNKNKLSAADLAQWKNKVSNYFESEKPYLQADLTLSDLATRLKTNTSVLSQVINSGFDKNFNDFVNTYRINEFKSKINTPQYRHYTLLALAFDCGFNSKTTFNRAFKKIEGKSPTNLTENE